MKRNTPKAAVDPALKPLLNALAGMLVAEELRTAESRRALQKTLAQSEPVKRVESKAIEAGRPRNGKK